MLAGRTLACCAGVAASMSSVFGKLAVSDIRSFCLKFISREYFCETSQRYLLVCFITMVIMSNAIMWSLFSKALNRSRSSIEATVANTACNFFFTAFFGWSIFGEELSLLWWCGAGFIVLGLLLMHRGIEKTNHKNKEA